MHNVYSDRTVVNLDLHIMRAFKNRSFALDLATSYLSSFSICERSTIFGLVKVRNQAFLKLPLNQ